MSQPIRQVKTLFGIRLLGLLSGLFFASPAISQTWLASPGSADWNTAANWDTNTVPNEATPSTGSTDASVTFQTSATTAVTLSSDVNLDGILFDSGASSYQVDTNGHHLQLWGAGVINNSGAAQTFHNAGNSILFFYDSASASNATLHNDGQMSFNGSSTAASATIVNNDSLSFNVDSTAGNAVITTNSYMAFNGDSNAGSASISNTAFLGLYDTASMANATVVNDSSLYFNGSSTAGNSNITTNSTLAFVDTSTAGAATLTANTGGLIDFQASGDGGTARVILNNGSLDIAAVTVSGVAMGSLEGSGSVYLGGKNLTVGSNDRSTTLTASIDDGAFSGSLTKDGTGIMTLTFANTYDGGTTIGAGTIRLDGAGSLGTGRVVNNHMLDISGRTSDLTLGSIEGSGTFYLGSFNLTVGGDNLDGTVTGDLTDGGYAGGTGASLTKTGTGTLTLTNANSYTGGTVLDQGTLVVEDSDGLGGTNSGNMVVNGGTLVVGGGPQTLVIGGLFYEAVGGDLRLGLDTGAWDGVTITGTAGLHGTLDILSYNSYQPLVGDTYEVLSATGGVSGQFTSWTNPTGTRWYPIYLPTAVLLQAIQPSFIALGLTDNQKSVGDWLDKDFENPALENFMLSEGTLGGAALRSDYEKISPADLASLYQADFAQAMNHASLIEDRLSGIRDAVEDHWGVFLDGNGHNGKIGGDGNAPGYQFNLGGMTAGLDRKFGKDLMGGLLLGYGQTNITTDKGSTVEETGGQVGLYGGLIQEGFHLEALLEAGLHSYKTKRSGYGGIAQGSVQGQQFSGDLGVGYDWHFDRMTLGPYAKGQYSYGQLTAFKEQGSQMPLAYPDQGQGALRSEAGLRASRSLVLGGMTFAPSLKMAWEHTYEGSRDQLSAGLDGSSETFTVEGPVTGEDALALAAGLSAQFFEGFSAYAQYQNRIGLKNFDSQSFSGGVNIGF